MHVGRVLRRFSNLKLDGADKRLLRPYLERTAGFSGAQLPRLTDLITWLTTRSAFGC